MKPFDEWLKDERYDEMSPRERDRAAEKACRGWESGRVEQGERREERLISKEEK
jgi:hypothetical protein